MNARKESMTSTLGPIDDEAEITADEIRQYNAAAWRTIALYGGGFALAGAIFGGMYLAVTIINALFPSG